MLKELRSVPLFDNQYLLGIAEAVHSNGILPYLSSCAMPIQYQLHDVRVPGERCKRAATKPSVAPSWVVGQTLARRAQGHCSAAVGTRRC
jgi:hypothetical protein